MSSIENEIRNMTDKATYDRLEKDVTAVKNDIAALTDQITDVLNAFAGNAQKQARRGYDQARSNAQSAYQSAYDDLSERGGAMYEAAQGAAASMEEKLEDVITQRPLATVGLAIGLGFLIGAAWRR